MPGRTPEFIYGNKNPFYKETAPQSALGEALRSSANYVRSDFPGEDFVEKETFKQLVDDCDNEGIDKFVYEDEETIIAYTEHGEQLDCSPGGEYYDMAEAARTAANSGQPLFTKHTTENGRYVIHYGIQEDQDT